MRWEEPQWKREEERERAGEGERAAGETAQIEWAQLMKFNSHVSSQPRRETGGTRVFACEHVWSVLGGRGIVEENYPMVKSKKIQGRNKIYSFVHFTVPPVICHV